jgi:hypothetical protein
MKPDHGRGRRGGDGPFGHGSCDQRASTRPTAEWMIGDETS